VSTFNNAMNILKNSYIYY